MKEEIEKIGIEHVCEKLAKELALKNEYGIYDQEIAGIIKVRDDVVAQDVCSLPVIEFLEELLKAKRHSAFLSDKTIRLLRAKIDMMTYDEIEEIYESLVGLKEQELWLKAVVRMHYSKEKMSFTCSKKDMLQALESLGGLKDGIVSMFYWMRNRTLRLYSYWKEIDVQCRGFYSKYIEMEFDYESLLNYCRTTMEDMLIFEESGSGISFNGIESSEC